MSEKKKVGRPTKDESGLTQRAITAISRAEKQEGENEALLEHAFLPYAATDPANLLSPDEVGKRVSAYWESCRQTGAMPNPPGMAAWLGVSQDAFREWLAGMGSQENRTLASRTYQMLHQTLIDRSLAGKVSPQLTMFFAQNWFGYQNKNTMELQQAAPAPPSLDKLAAEAAALPDGDVLDVSFVEVESGGRKHGVKRSDEK